MNVGYTAAEARDALARDYYARACGDLIERRISDGWLWGEIRLSDFEIKTHWTIEGEFVALLNARLRSTISEMAAHFCTLTFPVHDEPGEPCKAAWHWKEEAA